MNMIIICLIWFFVIATFSLLGGFTVPEGDAPIAMVVCIITPFLLFLLLFYQSKKIQRAVLSWNIIVIVMVHAWRAGGEALIALYQHGVLPPLFALPAGIGDILIGITAPYIAWRIIRDEDYILSSQFMVWNIFGLADLLIAVSSGLLHSGVFFNTPLTTVEMTRFSMVLFPTFLVPLMAILHLAALFIRSDRLYKKTGK